MRLPKWLTDNPRIAETAEIAEIADTGEVAETSRQECRPRWPILPSSSGLPRLPAEINIITQLAGIKEIIVDTAVFTEIVEIADFADFDKIVELAG